MKNPNHKLPVAEENWHRTHGQAMATFVLVVGILLLGLAIFALCSHEKTPEQTPPQGRRDVPVVVERVGERS
jgi:hypothetical protein